MEYKVTNNLELKRFEILSEGAVSFIAYQMFEGSISFTSEKVPEALEGKGIGSYLAKFVLDYAQENNLKVKPQCAFVRWYVDNHPEYQKNSLLHSAP